MGNVSSNKYHTLWICLVLAVAVLAAFWQVRQYDFISFDDNDYIVDNENVNAGLTKQGVVWAFTRAHSHNWHPLTWISHMLDCEIYGLRAGGHHFTNVLFHIANTLLLFLVLRRMTGRLWHSAFVAAAFALHPLHVESVGWVSERKDVLSTFFWILTMWTYIRYVERPAVNRYLVMLVVFALGLMAKQMLVTLPFVLLLLDYWPLNRLALSEQSCRDSTGTVTAVSARRCILEKLPLLILAISGAVTVYLIQHYTEVMKSIKAYPLSWRIGNALAAYVAYIAKTIWPVNLAIFYPHPKAGLPTWQISLAALLLSFITVVVICRIRQNPYLAVGWLWYIITLIPVIGLVQIGLHARADRYTYMTITGLFIMVAWAGSDIFARLHYRKVILSLLTLFLLLPLTLMTWRQAGHWRNSVTLYKHAARAVQNNSWAHHMLGKALLIRNKFDEAAIHFNEAMRIDPEFVDARKDLGLALLKQGKVDEAVTVYQQFLPKLPENTNELNRLTAKLIKKGRLKQVVKVYTESHMNLGLALSRQNKFDEAVKHFKEALRLNPDFAKAHRNMVYALLQQGKRDEAIEHCVKAMQRNPDHADMCNHLGHWFLEKNQLAEADGIFRKVLQSLPDNAGAHNGLGVILGRQGKVSEAITHFTQAIRSNPDFGDAHNNLGYALAQQGRKDEAIVHFRKALQLNPNYAIAHHYLAQAMLKEGKTAEAVKHFKETLRLSPSWLSPMNSLAWILATHKGAEFYDPDEALQLAERLCELTDYQQPEVLDTLAAASAAVGNFPKAVATAERALRKAEASKNKKLTEKIQSHLRLYKTGRPFIERTPKTPSN